MESAAQSEESKNPIVERALTILRLRSIQRQTRRDAKERRLKCERLAEKWRSVIAADPEMEGISFALEIGETTWKNAWIRDEDDREVLTKQDLIFQAVYEGLAPPYAYPHALESSKLREKCHRLARNVSKKVFPGEQALTNLFKLLGGENLSSAQYIQWLKEAWEYKYPADKDNV